MWSHFDSGEFIVGMDDADLCSHKEVVETMDVENLAN